MKFIIILIAMISTCVGHTQENKDQWKRMISSQLFIFPKSAELVVNPQIGAEYRFNYLFMPSASVGILMGNNAAHCTFDTHIRCKIFYDSRFFVKYGIKNTWKVSKYDRGVWNILADVSVGAELDENKFYEVGILLHPILLKNAVFSINTGIHF